MFGPADMDLERLVNELWCGNHGLGDVSRFLLRALRNDESAAKAEFSKFLQGKLSDGLLKLSRRAVGKDGRPHRHGRSLGARGRTMNGSKQSATGDTSWPAEGAIGPWRPLARSPCVRGKPDRAEAKRETSSTQFAPRRHVNRMPQTMRVKRLIRFENKTLEILDRIELAKIAGFDPAYIEGWGQGSSSFGSI
jgi:hypothetical protein